MSYYKEDKGMLRKEENRELDTPKGMLETGQGMQEKEKDVGKKSKASTRDNIKDNIKGLHQEATLKKISRGRKARDQKKGIGE